MDHSLLVHGRAVADPLKCDRTLPLRMLSIDFVSILIYSLKRELIYRSSETSSTNERGFKKVLRARFLIGWNFATNQHRFEKQSKQFLSLLTFWCNEQLTETVICR